MSNRHPAPDPDHSRDFVACDEVSIHIHVRSYRSAWLKAQAGALLLRVRQHVRSRLQALSQPRLPRPVLRPPGLFRRRNGASARAWPVTAAIHALVVNLSSMR